MCVEVVAQVVSAGDDGVAVVDTGAGLRRASLALLTLEGEPVAAGDWVLVHTGFVVERIDVSRAGELVRLRSGIDHAAGDARPAVEETR